MQVIWSALAERDLTGIRAYLAEDKLNPIAAEKVSADIRDAAQALAEFPLLGHEGEDGTREWMVGRRPDYLLIYDVDGDADAVVILRVWHQKRYR